MWRLNCGDLDHNGNICTSDGFTTISAGDVWVTKKQAKSAQVYGWNVIGKRGKLLLVRRVWAGRRYGRYD